MEEESFVMYSRKLGVIIKLFMEMRYTQLENETGVDWSKDQVCGESVLLILSVCSLRKEIVKNPNSKPKENDIIDKLCTVIEKTASAYKRGSFVGVDATSIFKILKDNSQAMADIVSDYINDIALVKTKRVCEEFSWVDGSKMFTALLALSDPLQFAQQCLTGRKTMNASDHSKGQYSELTKCKSNLYAYKAGRDHMKSEEIHSIHDEITDDSGAHGGGHKAAHAMFINIRNGNFLGDTVTWAMAPIREDHEVDANNEDQGRIDGTNEDYPAYKLVLLGDSGTGKTEFAQRHLNGLRNINGDAHVCVYTLEFDTNSGPKRFHCWDIPGHPNLNQDDYLHCADCAIIIFDVTNAESFFNVSRKWRRDISRVCGGIPVVICGNKVDLLNDRVVRPRAVARSLRRSNAQYYEVCARNNYNFERPFLYLLRQLMNSDVYFVSAPALAPAPAEVQVDLEAQERNEVEFETAMERLR